MGWRTRRRFLAGLGAAGTLGFAGCSDTLTQETQTATQATLSPSSQYGYTHIQPTGNRVLDDGGSGSIHDVEPVEISVETQPRWLVALPAGLRSRSRSGSGSESESASEQGSFWTIVTVLGSARTVRVADGTATTVADHQALPAGLPPLTRRSGSGVGLVRPPENSAPRTHPVVTESGLLYVTENGELVHRGDQTQRWQIDALPDGRIVHVSGSRYALLGDRTTRYKHAALGDTVEGGSLVIVDVAAGELVARRQIDPPAVIEGLSPLIADLDGDGAPEIITTVADSSDGARIVVYDTDGQRRATGPIHGSGWRHQLCVAPFAPDGQQELAVVRQPHVDRVVEFYQLQGGDLSITAEVSNVASHTYGSYNVDGGLAADLDGDGTVELLVPLIKRRQLLAIRRTSDGGTTAWQLSLDGSLETNITGVSLSDGRVAVGAGTSDRVIVWQG